MQSKDADYWAKLHIESDRRKPIELSDRRSRFMTSPISPRRQKEQAQ